VLVWEEMSSTAVVVNIEAGVTEVTVFIVKNFCCGMVRCVTLSYVKYKTVRTSVKTLR